MPQNKRLILLGAMITTNGNMIISEFHGNIEMQLLNGKTIGVKWNMSLTTTLHKMPTKI